MSEIVPIKALPDDATRSKEILALGVWLDGILSLEGEKSVKRLEILLPIIKDTAWSLSIEEIKKAFTMYVKGDLPIEPRDNYLTVILFNRVIKEYKKIQMTKIEKPKKSADELKAEQDVFDAINHFDQFKASRKLDDSADWLYSFLEFKGLIEYSDKEKVLNFNLAMQQVKGNIGDKKRKKQEAIILAKRALLRKYFERLEAKNQHLKDLL